jgi:hypothetical protein
MIIQVMPSFDLKNEKFTLFNGYFSVFLLTLNIFLLF